MGLFWSLRLMTWQSVFATGDVPGEQGQNHCPLGPRLRNCIQYCHFHSFLLVTQVNPVHCVRRFTSTWKGNKDYWELFGGQFGRGPLNAEVPYQIPLESHPITAVVWSPGSHRLTEVQAWMRLLGSSSSNTIHLLLQTWELETGYPFPSTNPRYGGIGLG